MKILKNNLGMTLAELVIVLSITSIIGAILIPSFINTSDKARLKSDIQTAISLQSIIDIYNAENSKAITTDDTTIEYIVNELKTNGYINSSRNKPQTNCALYKVILDENMIKVDLESCDVKIFNIAKKLSPEEISILLPIIPDEKN